MKEKNKGKKMWNKDFRAKKDMEKILSDSRFAHVPFDPKLRHLPKEERKVKLDSRFTSMFSDDKFYEKSTMDPRGRKGNYSTKEDLRKFYHMSSDEDESDDDEENEEELEDIEERDEGEEEEEREKNDTEENHYNEEAFKESKEDQKEREEISEDILERLQDMTQDYARGALLFSDDSSDDDSSSEEEEREEEFDWGEVDQDAIWDTEQEVEETSRIAVCNLDWNHIKAVDIIVVFNSFCPRGGSVNNVTIYPSEFGKERMAEEDKFGPMELTAESANGSDKEVNLEKLEKGKLDYGSERTKGSYEALRRYERNRLRYYYAVVECDSVATAKVLYKECDRQSFERAGIFMDLRYIPADMTFDEAPHEVCGTVPEFYEAKLFTTTALFDSQPTLTWDQTDPHRQKVLSNAMRNAMCGKEINEEYLKNYIASSSEDEDSLSEEEEDFSSDEGEDTKTARIAKFRALIQEIDEKEKKKKTGRFDMEEVFGIEDKEEDKEDVSEENEDEKKKDLNPFEKYLEKRKNKRKERKKGKKTEASKKQDNSSDENNSKAEYSDDELPDKMGDLYKDPFFAEELKNREKQGSKEKKKRKKRETKKEETNDIAQGDLELLLMEEDKEEKQHFSMRDIIDDHKGKSKKKLKKKAKQKMEEKMKKKASYEEDFKVDTKDPRFSTLLTSGEYNIDPSHPQFKRTKAMDNLINDVQKKRIADSFETTPDPKRINVSRGREEHELSLLVKRVKSKTKKPKKS